MKDSAMLDISSDFVNHQTLLFLARQISRACQPPL
jgi:hypothetical protein